MTERPTPRTWNDGWRCAECCNGDRCDDPTHHDRDKCPHCKGTGIAVWNMYTKEAEAKALITERDALRAALREACPAPGVEPRAWWKRTEELLGEAT